MKSYDLNLLRALDALLATASVTAAAQRMHLSTPAMSHALARLREAFGDPLLVRAGRRLVPTARAQALAGPVRQLLEQAQALQVQAAPADLSVVRRRFVVRAPEGMAIGYGVALEAQLNACMPLASLQFLPESHDDPTGLREGRIDLDLGSGLRQDPELVVQALSDRSMVGVVAAGHPLVAKAVTVRRFAMARHVEVASLAGEVSVVDAALAAQGLQRRVSLVVPSAFAALIACARSQLVTCAPERTARAMAGSLGLHLFALPLPLPTAPLRLAWHPRQHPDPAHRWLRETLMEALRSGASVPS
ncbi:MAG: LysR family transcriptional regulator [Giesbergeria sp.]